MRTNANGKRSELSINQFYEPKAAKTVSKKLNRCRLSNCDPQCQKFAFAKTLIISIITFVLVLAVLVYGAVSIKSNITVGAVISTRFPAVGSFDGPATLVQTDMGYLFVKGHVRSDIRGATLKTVANGTQYLCDYLGECFKVL